MHGVNSLLMKGRQGSSNCIKKASLFFFCKILCLVDLKNCVCLNRTKPWSELSIKFNQCSGRSFQKALVRFNNLWIRLVFKEFNWVSVSKISNPPFKMESWTSCPGGLIFIVVPGELYSFLSFLFNFSKFNFFKPFPTEGRIKWLLSVCLSVSLAYLLGTFLF